MVAPVFVGRTKSISAIEAAFADESPLILCAQREAGVEDPSFGDLRPVGVGRGCCSGSDSPTGA